MEIMVQDQEEIFRIGNLEWAESVELLIQNESAERVKEILELLQNRASKESIHFNSPSITSYINTIPACQEKPYPGSSENERKIKSIIRWNAMAMVEGANRDSDGIEIDVARFPTGASGRAKTRQTKNGLTKLVVDTPIERIPGLSIGGRNAGELTEEGTLAVEMAAAVTDLAHTIHPHPTLSETLMEAADVYFGRSIHIYKSPKINPSNDKSGE